MRRLKNTLGTIQSLAPLALFVSVATGSTRARADVPGVDIRTFPVSLDPLSGRSYESVKVPDRWSFSFISSVAFSAFPVSLHDGNTGALVARPVTETLHLDLGASVVVARSLLLGLGVPMVFQSGNAGLRESWVTGGEASPAAFGDLQLHAKYSVLANDGGGLGFAIASNVAFPTGGKRSFASDNAVRVGVRALAGYDLLFAAVHASLGYRLRTTTTRWPDAPSGFVFGDDLPWSISASFRPGFLSGNNRHHLDFGFAGSLPMGPVYPFGAGSPGSAALTPVSLSLGDRIVIQDKVELVVGLEIGLTNAMGMSPLRPSLSLQYVSKVRDKDHDGVDDEKDECPDIAEDHDGIEDEDGCPDVE